MIISVNEGTPIDKIPEGMMVCIEKENGHNRLTIGPRTYHWHTNAKNNLVCSVCNKEIIRSEESMKYVYCPYCATKMYHTLYTI